MKSILGYGLALAMMLGTTTASFACGDKSACNGKASKEAKKGDKACKGNKKCCKGKGEAKS